MKRLLFLVAVAVSVLSAQTNTSLMPDAHHVFTDRNGKPLSGGLVYTCVANMTCPGNPKATYTDSSGTTQNANPVVLDSAGYASIWVNPGVYKIVLTNSSGVQQWTQDNVSLSANGGFNPDVPLVSTVANPPAFQYFPVPYTPLSYTNADNSSIPASFETTLGTIASPVLTEVPGMFCSIVGSTASTSSNTHNGDGSAQPACIKAYSIAVAGATATANVMSVVGVSQTNGGCGGNPSAPCQANQIGGIAVAGFSNLNTNTAPTWGGWFTANDHGFNGGLSGAEFDIFRSATGRVEGDIRGIQVVDVDMSGGTVNSDTNWGLFSAGFGKGFVYSSGGLPGTSFNAFYVESGTAAANLDTTVLGFQPGQEGPFAIGLDFTNATFTDSAIKNASIKQATFLTGITNGSGFETFSACFSSCTVTVTPCTTAATAGAVCTTSITLPVAMANTAYHASCSGQSISGGAPSLYIAGKPSGSSITVGTMAVTAAAATFGEIDCFVSHN